MKIKEWEPGIGCIKTRFRKGDAVKKFSYAALWGGQERICIITEICNGLVTIEDSNGVLYLAFLDDLDYIGHKTECVVVTKTGEILLDW